MPCTAYHPSFSHPLPAGHRFPMQKYALLHAQLQYEGVLEPHDFFEPTLVDPEHVLRVHDVAYWDKLKHLSLSSKEIRRIGFPLSAELIQRELRIAQGSIQAAVYALQHGLGFNIAGGTHHAGPDWGEGFCLLNDQAIAAAYLLDKALVKQVLILDLDVHQGNGTARIFNVEDRVFTCSMHGASNFPFNKEESDWDLPLNDHIQDAAYLEMLKQLLPKLIERVRPDFVFYQSGVDVLETDKLGKLSLSRMACKERDDLVYQAFSRVGLPVQTSMGGGYSSSLREIVDAHCQTFKSGIQAYG